MLNDAYLWPFFTEPNTAYDTRMYTTKVYCYNVEIYLTCCERH